MWDACFNRLAAVAAHITLDECESGEQDKETTEWKWDPLRWELDPPCTEAEWKYLSDTNGAPDFMALQQCSYMNKICRGCYNSRLLVMAKELQPSMKMRKDYEAAHQADLLKKRPALSSEQHIGSCSLQLGLTRAFSCLTLDDDDVHPPTAKERKGEKKAEAKEKVKDEKKPDAATAKERKDEKNAEAKEKLKDDKKADAAKAKERKDEKNTEAKEKLKDDKKAEAKE
eukprot:s878_g1.t1